MPVLLGHQQALQLVGQAGDHPLHGRQLLVQERTQPRQFLGLAQIGGHDLFIEFGGEYLVAPFVLMGERRLMAVGLGAVFRLDSVAQFVGRFGNGIAFHFLTVFRVGGGFRCRAFAFLLRVLVLAIFILAFGIFALGIFVRRVAFVGLLAQRQVIEQGTGQAREGLLVAQRIAQLFQIGAG